MGRAKALCQMEAWLCPCNQCFSLTVFFWFRTIWSPQPYSKQSDVPHCNYQNLSQTTVVQKGTTQTEKTQLMGRQKRQKPLGPPSKALVLRLCDLHCYKLTSQKGLSRRLWHWGTHRPLNTLLQFWWHDWPQSFQPFPRTPRISTILDCSHDARRKY